MSFTHRVTLIFKDDALQDDINLAIQKLHDLQNKIKRDGRLVIKSFKEYLSQLNKAASRTFVMRFDNEEDFKCYLDHEEHLKVKSIIVNLLQGELSTSILVTDYDGKSSSKLFAKKEPLEYKAIDYYDVTINRDFASLRRKIEELGGSCSIKSIHSIENLNRGSTVAIHTSWKKEEDRDRYLESEVRKNSLTAATLVYRHSKKLLMS